MTQARQQHGFTLIELIAAITLLAVLTTILMGTVRGAERSTSAAKSGRWRWRCPQLFNGHCARNKTAWIDRLVHWRCSTRIWCWSAAMPI